MWHKFTNSQHSLLVGVGIVPQIQPIPVVQGPVNVPPAIHLPPDGDNNNNDSSIRSSWTG